jgi:hypothetical protein
MTAIKRIYYWLLPALFCLYPVLALYSANEREISFTDIMPLFGWSLILAAVIFLLWMALTTSLRKTSLITVFWLIVFFSYGQVYTEIHQTLGAALGRNAILFPLAAAVMIYIALWIWKFVRDFRFLSTFFGIVTAVLLAFVAYQILSFNLTVQSASASIAAHPISVAAGSTATEKPDIYYIILDAHGREDMLQSLYGYDSTSFIKFLQQKGFFVGTSSHSNYAQTELSLSSSLNMEYLDTIGLPTRNATAGRAWLDGKIQHSLVRQLLAAQGYQLITFANSYPTVPTDAAIYYSFDKTPQAAESGNNLGYSEMESLFISTTMARFLVDWAPLTALTNNQAQYKFHYEQIQYTFATLADVPDLPGTYFIFAHILAPHPPFVFTAEGQFLINTVPYTISDGSFFPGTRQQYIDGYRGQVAYVDLEVEKVVTSILAHSKIPPIIILQGDHGPGAFVDWGSAAKTNVNDRMSILNAYYFQGKTVPELYPSITPVNTFRVLFNTYFGGNYPLLADRSYFSLYATPFNYINVSGRLTR